MMILKGNNIRIYPNKEQYSRLCSTFGCVRWLWNNFLDMENKRYENNPKSKFLTTYSLNRLLPQVKREYPWLKEVDSTALTVVSDDINFAFMRFFKKNSKHPRFKSKKYEQTYTSKCVNNNIRIIDDHHIRLPKIGIVYFKGTVPQGKIKRATVRLKPSGKIFVSVLCETEVEKLPLTKKEVGIDLGLIELATFDDGKKIPLPRFDKHLENQLRYWQKIAARKLLKAKKVIKSDPSKTLYDFKNYQTARAMVAKYHEKITNQRKDYLHKLSYHLVHNYDVIILEDLKAKVMLKNHSLARAISNAGWNTLVEMIRYKCEWYGKTLITVESSFTSQTCNICGSTNKKLGYNRYGWLKVREWKCDKCQSILDRDVNAAINIKNRGLTQIT